ncbi:MAG: hypothetical protein BMS9Abin31_0242 [Gammaproteobacteria bacterium]|nr:MAG: hypothetical protein BMS9Abin31_0242 [Gammaproteobacteria bacterium]
MLKFCNTIKPLYWKYSFLSLNLIFSSPLLSGEVFESHVSYKKGIYHASLEMQIKAPVKKVYALLTDFDYLSRLSDNIIDSDLIDDDPPEYIVEVKTHNCVLFFCKNLKQRQAVLEFDDGYISVEDIKGESDFVFANTLWHIRASKGETRVSFRTEMKPDFWLPPLLGPWLFKNKLVENTQMMIERLEQLATDDK